MTQEQRDQLGKNAAEYDLYRADLCVVVNFLKAIEQGDTVSLRSQSTGNYMYIQTQLSLRHISRIARVALMTLADELQRKMEAIPLLPAAAAADPDNTDNF